MKLKRRFRKLRALWTGMVEAVVVPFPGEAGERMRRAYWRRRLRRLGEKVRISENVYFQNPEYISLDDNCWIDRNVMILAGPPGGSRVTSVRPSPGFPLATGEVYIGPSVHVSPNCVLSGLGGIYIGRNAGIAANCSVFSYSQHYKNAEDEADRRQFSFTPQARHDQQSMVLGPIYIGDYCGIGLNSVVLPGTWLGRGTWVASGSVVRGRFEEQSLVTTSTTNSTKSIAHLDIIE